MAAMDVNGSTYASSYGSPASRQVENFSYMALATDIDQNTLSNIRSRVERACQPFFDNDRVRSGAAVTPFVAVNMHEQQSTTPLAAPDNRDAAAATPSSMSSGVTANTHLTYVDTHTPMATAFNLGRPMSVAATAAVPEVMLFPEEDVEQVVTDTERYWYNPKTWATSWKREDLVETNKRFYERVKHLPSKSMQRGPNGETRYWAWSNKAGVFHSSWTLKDLWSLVTSKGLQ